MSDSAEPHVAIGSTEQQRNQFKAMAQLVRQNGIPDGEHSRILGSFSPARTSAGFSF